MVRFLFRNWDLTVKIIDNAELKTANEKYDKLLADHLEKEGDKLEKVKVKRRADGTIQLFISYYKDEELPSTDEE